VEKASLATLFEEFSERLNGSVRLRPILARWTPVFHIESRDTDETFKIHIEDGLVRRIVRLATEPEDDGLLLRADKSVLQQVFSGQLSPLAAYTDGLLEVYGPQKDQIKLDAIALVLWEA
jgi:hypothetical protein